MRAPPRTREAHVAIEAQEPHAMVGQPECPAVAGPRAVAPRWPAAAAVSPALPRPACVADRSAIAVGMLHGEHVRHHDATLVLVPARGRRAGTAPTERGQHLSLDARRTLPRVEGAARAAAGGVVPGRLPTPASSPPRRPAGGMRARGAVGRSGCDARTSATTPPQSAAWRVGDIQLCYSAAPHRPGAYQDGRGESTVRVASWAAAVEQGLAAGDRPMERSGPCWPAWTHARALAAGPGLASMPASPG